MAKQLTLFRHAKSSWAEPGLRDFDRGLNQRGLRDAKASVARLSDSKEQADHICSSPARRALDTANIIASGIHYPAERIETLQGLYHASSEQMIAIIRQQAATIDRLWLFGHNPGLTELAQRCGAESLQNLATCGLIRFDCAINTWAEFTPGLTMQLSLQQAPKDFNYV